MVPKGSHHEANPHLPLVPRAAALQIFHDGMYVFSPHLSLLAISVVFWCTGTAGYTLLEYRLGHKRFLEALLENLVWIPFLYDLLLALPSFIKLHFFFQASFLEVFRSRSHKRSSRIYSHTTVKEVERSHFFREIPRIMPRRF